MTLYCSCLDPPFLFKNRFQAHANINRPTSCYHCYQGFRSLVQDRVEGKMMTCYPLNQLLIEMPLLCDICWLVVYLLGTKAKLYLWQIACRSLNNEAVTRNRTLVIFRVLRIRLWCTILYVGISIALTRINRRALNSNAGNPFYQKSCALMPFFIDLFIFPGEKFAT